MTFNNEQAFVDAFSHVNLVSPEADKVIAFELLSQAAFTERGGDRTHVNSGFYVDPSKNCACLSDEMIAEFDSLVNNASAIDTSVRYAHDLGYAVILTWPEAQSDHTRGVLVFRNNLSYRNWSHTTVKSVPEIRIDEQQVLDGVAYTAHATTLNNILNSGSGAYCLGGPLGEHAEQTGQYEAVYGTLTPRWFSELVGEDKNIPVVVDASGYPWAFSGQGLMDVTLPKLANNSYAWADLVSSGAAAVVATTLADLFISKNEGADIAPDIDNLYIGASTLDSTVYSLRATTDDDAVEVLVVTVQDPVEDDSNYIYQIRSPKAHSTGIGRKNDLLLVLYKPTEEQNH